MNEIQQMFWEIINDENAVQIKLEVAKGLRNFTLENTKQHREEKDEKLAEQGQIDR